MTRRTFGARFAPRLDGFVRIVHPFPSVLDAVAAASIALVAGAEPRIAARLALAMLCFQFAVGVTNDLADLPSDRLAHPSKPLVTGALASREALGIFILALSVAVVVAASVGIGPLAIGLVGFADGLLYDLRLKGTPFAWLAFAAGVGLLPAYAWFGATNGLPPTLLGVAGMAVLAGAALAFANALADLEKDAAAGTRTVATMLGRDRTLALDVCLVAVLQGVVLATTFLSGPEAAPIAVEVAGACIGWAGLRL
ncbi:MAG TPA: UbiA family prenyltransferase, partial [Candidatus Limnocylindrales bacterium]